MAIMLYLKISMSLWRICAWKYLHTLADLYCEICKEYVRENIYTLIDLYIENKEMGVYISVNIHYQDLKIF